MDHICGEGQCIQVKTTFKTDRRGFLGFQRYLRSGFSLDDPTILQQLFEEYKQKTRQGRGYIIPCPPHICLLYSSFASDQSVDVDQTLPSLPQALSAQAPVFVPRSVLALHQVTQPPGSRAAQGVIEETGEPRSSASSRAWSVASTAATSISEAKGNDDDSSVRRPAQGPFFGNAGPQFWLNRSRHAPAEEGRDFQQPSSRLSELMTGSTPTTASDDRYGAIGPGMIDFPKAAVAA